MMTLCVGDLHGNLEIARKAIAQNTTDRVVFLGDYLDSFNRSKEDQYIMLTEILNAVRDDPKRFTALKGNHEMSYLDDDMMCSGWNVEMQSYINHIGDRLYCLTKDFVWEQGFLISHAGVSKRLLEVVEKDLEVYLEHGDFDQIGVARGGMCTTGGLFWNDWNFEHEPLDGVSQIVGHTHYRYKEKNGIHKIEHKGGVDYNIDCLPQLVAIDPDENYIPVLVIEDGIAREENLLEL